MAEPTNYDKLQDGRLDDLESLITAEYQPPAGAQYSYPIANQGITQDQWQQMMLSMGDGAIVTEDSEHFFRLVKHDTDAETNQRNTLIMKVAQNTGRNEASLAGFYFRQTEDIELPFPPVTSTTVYHVTVTYDPRKFKTEPLRLEVWAGEPPRNHGQRHLVLRTVQRGPNQLLSQAPISTLRHYVSPVITAVTEAGLPDSKDVLYGTLGIVRSRTSGGTVVPGTGSIFESRGTHGWHNLLLGDWYTIPLSHGWEVSQGLPVMARHTPLGVQMKGSATRVTDTSETRMGTIPTAYRPSQRQVLRPHILAPGSFSQAITIDPDGAMNLRLSARDYRTDGARFDGIIYPYN